jgi:hypothetical protein
MAVLQQQAQLFLVVVVAVHHKWAQTEAPQPEVVKVVMEPLQVLQVRQ